MSLAHDTCRECSEERQDDGSCGCGGDERDWVIDPARIHAHVGHDIEIVTYANQNLAIECVSCGTVLADIDYWTKEVTG